MATDQNGTWLFRLAQEWYLTHPGEQIPQAVWANKVQEALRLCDEERGLSPSDLTQPSRYERFDISAHDWRVVWASPDMIPVLAAVTLGFSTEELASVVQHHNIGRVQLSQCSVLENFIDERTDFRPEDTSRLKLGHWMLVEKVMKAITLNQEEVKGLINEIAKNEINSDIKVACLLTEIPDLWPSKAVEARLDTLRSGTTDTEYFQYPFIDSGTLLSLDDLHDFSNDELLKILERSGVMTLGATKENGFAAGFFFELFEALAQPDYPDASEDYEELGEPKYNSIVRALNSIECPAQLGRFNARIREVMSDIDHNSLICGMNALKNLEAVLDPVKYADVMNDLVLKINLLQMQGMHYPRQTDEGPAFDAIYIQPSLLLSRLASQLMETDSNDFNRTHFQTLSRILKYSRAEQDIDSIDMNHFVLKLIDAFEAYLKVGNFDSRGREIHYLKDRTADHLGSFLQYAVDRIVDFDYSRIERFSNDSRLLLAKSGFDLKKLPRLNNKGLGELLSERMGL